MSGITFQKRQKEMKRQEKQRMKAEKRAQRKLQQNAGPAPETPQVDDTQQFDGAPKLEDPATSGPPDA